MPISDPDDPTQSEIESFGAAYGEYLSAYIQNLETMGIGMTAEGQAAWREKLTLAAIVELYAGLSPLTLTVAEVDNVARYKFVLVELIIALLQGEGLELSSVKSRLGKEAGYDVQAIDEVCSVALAIAYPYMLNPLSYSHDPDAVEAIAIALSSQCTVMRFARLDAGAPSLDALSRAAAIIGSRIRAYLPPAEI